MNTIWLISYIIIAILSGRFIVFPVIDLVRKISFIDEYFEYYYNLFSDEVIFIAAFVIAIAVAIFLYFLLKGNTVYMLIGVLLIPLLTFILLTLVIILVAAALWTLTAIIGIVFVGIILLTVLWAWICGDI